MTGIEGLDELRRKLGGLVDDVSSVLEEAGTKGMLIVEGATKEDTPVRTGHLRRSYTTETIGETPEEVTIATGTNVEYAPHVETRKPHLRPAFDENRDRVIAVVRSELVRVVEEAAR